MICLVLFLAVASSAMAGYADSSSGSNKVGNGYGYGYSGSFSGDGGGFGGPLPQFPQFDFNNFLQSYFDSLKKYHEQFAAHALSYSVARSDPRSKSEAQSSLTFQNQGIQQGAGFSGYGYPGGFPAYAGHPGSFPGQGGSTGGFPGQGGSTGGDSGYGGGFGNSFSGAFGPGQEGASASAAIGPQGVHQTAGVYPENPNYPNIDNRFGATPQEGGGGFYSVSTSSQSGSSNVDGKPTSFHQATTTVNDNGKVTTYTVKKP